MSLKQPWLRGERNSLRMTQGPDFMSGPFVSWARANCIILMRWMSGKNSNAIYLSGMWADGAESFGAVPAVRRLEQYG